MKTALSLDARQARVKGFTRLELAATLAVCAGLAFVSAPAIGNTRTEAQIAECIDNHRQLIRAWQSFGVSNDEVLAGGMTGDSALQPRPFRGTGVDPWATGWMDWSNAIGNTNTQYLIDPAYAALADFIGPRKDIFKCPSDNYLSSSQKSARWGPRVRSISMNVAVGNGNATVSNGPWNPAFVRAVKLSQMVTPPPSSVFVFLDEHPDSINDTVFYPPNGGPNSLTWVDLPAALHEGAGTLSFADGHTELHRWSSFLRNLKVTTVSFPQPVLQQADLRYLYDHTPRIGQ